MKKHFDILGLEEGASQEAIQEAYDRLSKELDPQKNGNHEFFLEEYALLQDAYHELTNNSNIIPSTSQQKNPIPSSDDSVKKPDLDNKIKPNQGDKSFFSSNNMIIVYIVVVFIFVLIAIQKCNSNDESDDSAVATDTPSVAVDTASVAVDTGWIPPPDAIEVFETPENGSSPLDSCFGRGEYYGHATLTIKNGDFSDAIVCLYNVTEGKTIRNEYVQKNSSFTMSSIAEGDYKIRILSGNNWNPIDINSCGGKGKFESDVSFYEFDGTNFFQDSNGKYSTNTVTLYGVEGGTATSSSMNEDEFFK